MASGAPSGELAGMVEPVLDSMGYELVDVEYGAGGLLRIVIDIVGGSRHVQVEDCEKVSHQLGRLFMVEGVDYDRLEVSSPGLDRPLKKPSDFERFAGEKVTLRLRQPIDGRRQFTGVLRKEGAEGAEAGRLEGAEAVKADGAAARWVLFWSDEPAVVPARKGKGRRRRAQGRAGRAGAERAWPRPARLPAAASPPPAVQERKRSRRVSGSSFHWIRSRRPGWCLSLLSKGCSHAGS